MTEKYYLAVLRESKDSRMSINGGDYNEGVTVKVVNNITIGGRYWTSSDFDICRGCGRYQNENCCDTYSGPIPEKDIDLIWEEIEPIYTYFLPIE